MPARAEFTLRLTVGGGAELTDNDHDMVVWESVDDPDFMEEFPDFLKQDDLADILDYLVEIGELTELQADRCEVREDFIEAADLAGMMRKG